MILIVVFLVLCSRFQHSMIYFFHHYELPVIIQQAQVQQILRLRTRQRHQQQNGNGAATTNNASNLRNGSNAMGNQANNSNATGGNGGGGGSGAGAGNQVNNSGNNNNHPLNNHQRTLFAIISMITNVQVVSMLLNSILNALGVVQGRLINYAFGTAAFSNNNNDNRLNNNNITNNNRGNNPSMNFTRLRINLSRLRRINLAGIQINPVEMNPADVHAERAENSNNDGSDGTNDTGNRSAAADANRSLSREVDAATSSSSTTVENDQRDHEISAVDHPRSPATSSADFDLDFDIIDANAEVAINPNDLQLNVGQTIANNDPQDGGALNRQSNAPKTITSISTTVAPTLRCDLQVQSISSLSNCEPADNVPNDRIGDRSNHLMAFDRSPSNADGNDDSCYQIRSSKSCQNESHQQGDNQDHRLSNTKTDDFKAEPSAATFESADQTSCSLLSALAQKSDAISCETQDSTATATDAHISTNEY